MVVSNLVPYITEVLAPNLNRIVLASSEDMEDVSNIREFEPWEEYYWNQVENSKLNKFTASIYQVGRAILLVAVIVALLGTFYGFSMRDPTFVLSGIEVFLLATYHFER